MKRIELKYIEFIDAAGTKRELRGCPLDKLAEFDRTVRELWYEMSKHPDESIADSYHCYLKVQQLTNRCLQLCNLKPEWFTVAMMVQLLHQYQTPDGIVHKGLLIEENLPHLAFDGISHQLQLKVLADAYKELINLRYKD